MNEKKTTDTLSNSENLAKPTLDTSNENAVSASNTQSKTAQANEASAPSEDQNTASNQNTHPRTSQNASTASAPSKQKTQNKDDNKANTSPLTPNQAPQKSSGKGLGVVALLLALASLLLNFYLYQALNTQNAHNFPQRLQEHKHALELLREDVSQQKHLLAEYVQTQKSDEQLAQLIDARAQNLLAEYKASQPENTLAAITAYGQKLKQDLDTALNSLQESQKSILSNLEKASTQVNERIRQAQSQASLALQRDNQQLQNETTANFNALLERYQDALKPDARLILPLLSQAEAAYSAADYALSARLIDAAIQELSTLPKHDALMQQLREQQQALLAQAEQHAQNRAIVVHLATLQTLLIRKNTLILPEEGSLGERFKHAAGQILQQSVNVRRLDEPSEDEATRENPDAELAVLRHHIAQGQKVKENAKRYHDILQQHYESNEAQRDSAAQLDALNDLNDISLQDIIRNILKQGASS